MIFFKAKITKTIQKRKRKRLDATRFSKSSQRLVHFLKNINAADDMSSTSMSSGKK